MDNVKNPRQELLLIVGATVIVVAFGGWLLYRAMHRGPAPAAQSTHLTRQQILESLTASATSSPNVSPGVMQSLTAPAKSGTGPPQSLIDSLTAPQ